MPLHSHIYSMPLHSRIYSMPLHSRIYSMPLHSHIYSMPLRRLTAGYTHSRAVNTAATLPNIFAVTYACSTRHAGKPEFFISRYVSFSKTYMCIIEIKKLKLYSGAGAGGRRERTCARNKIISIVQSR